MLLRADDDETVMVAVELALTFLGEKVINVIIHRVDVVTVHQRLKDLSRCSYLLVLGQLLPHRTELLVADDFRVQVVAGKLL